MKRLFAILALLALLAAPSRAFAVSSTMEQLPWSAGGMKVLTLTLTASSTTATYSAHVTHEVNGIVLMAETDSGTVTPTDNYDITLTKASATSGHTAVDIFGGNLANRDEESVERAMPLQDGSYTGVPNRGPLTVNITNNSVNSAVVIIRIFYY